MADKRMMGDRKRLKGRFVLHPVVLHLLNQSITFYKQPHKVFNWELLHIVTVIKEVTIYFHLTSHFNLSGKRRKKERKKKIQGLTSTI